MLEKSLSICSSVGVFFRPMESFSPVQVNSRKNTTVHRSLYIVNNKIPIEKDCIVKNKKRNRRPIHSNKRFKLNENFLMISHNVASLKSKFLSFSKVLADLNPKLWTLQETHMKMSGKIKFQGSEGYQIYELTRNDRSGGGLAIGVSKKVQSVWVRQGEGEVETLTVMVNVSGLSVRVTNGYGPQEYDSKEKKENFWQYLQDEVNFCNNEGIGCIFALDANSWLGNKIISGDPHCQNQNGKIFNDFLNNNWNLSLLNQQKYCQGKITRVRKVQNKVEYSIIDFIIVCEKVFQYAKLMIIDEPKKYALTNFYHKKKGKQANTSDHNLIIVEFSFKCIKQQKERKCLFNYNNVDSILKFKNLTTKSDQFTDCFQNNKPFPVQIKRWEKVLNRTIYSCFDKIRLKSESKSKNFNSYILDLLNKWKFAIIKGDFEKRENIEIQIKQYEREEHINIADKNIRRLKDKSKQGFWRIKAKLFPNKQSKIPIAKKNINGQLISNHFELKKVYLEHFKFRLRERPILYKYELNKIQVEIEFNEILERTKDVKIRDWNEN